jgi:hypothetical protein
MALTTENRARLDEIVKKLHTQKAPKATVVAIVNDFKAKYDVPEAPEASVTAPQPFGLRAIPVDVNRIGSALGEAAVIQNPASTALQTVGAVGEVAGVGAIRGLQQVGTNLVAVKKFASNVSPYAPVGSAYQAAKFLSKQAAPVARFIGGVTTPASKTVGQGVQDFAKNWEFFKQDNPEMARNYEAVANTIGGILPFKLGGKDLLRGATAAIEGAATGVARGAARLAKVEVSKKGPGVATRLAAAATGVEPGALHEVVQGGGPAIDKLRAVAGTGRQITEDLNSAIETQKNTAFTQMEKELRYDPAIPNTSISPVAQGQVIEKSVKDFRKEASTKFEEMIDAEHGKIMDEKVATFTNKKTGFTRNEAQLVVDDILKKTQFKEHTGTYGHTIVDAGDRAKLEEIRNMLGERTTVRELMSAKRYIAEKVNTWAPVGSLTPNLSSGMQAMLKDVYKGIDETIKTVIRRPVRAAADELDKLQGFPSTVKVLPNKKAASAFAKQAGMPTAEFKEAIKSSDFINKQIVAGYEAANDYWTKAVSSVDGINELLKSGTDNLVTSIGKLSTEDVKAMKEMAGRGEMANIMFKEIQHGYHDNLILRSMRDDVIDVDKFSEFVKHPKNAERVREVLGDQAVNSMEQAIDKFNAATGKMGGKFGNKVFQEADITTATNQSLNPQRAMAQIEFIDDVLGRKGKDRFSSQMRELAIAKALGMKETGKGVPWLNQGPDYRKYAVIGGIGALAAGGYMAAGEALSDDKHKNYGRETGLGIAGLISLFAVSPAAAYIVLRSAKVALPGIAAVTSTTASGVATAAKYANTERSIAPVIKSTIGSINKRK